MSDAGLLHTLVRHPDAGALRVYADELIERGEPQGELITLQLERAAHGGPATPREETLRAHFEAGLKEAFGVHFMGCQWRHGFLSAVSFFVDDRPLEPFARLSTRPEAQLVETVLFDANQWEDAGDLSPVWEALRASPRLPRLKAVHVHGGGFGLGNPWITGPIEIGDVSPLYEAYPALEVLELDGVHHHLGPIDLPKLTHFRAALLGPEHVPDVVRARWPSLRELDLEFTQGSGEAEPVFGPLLASRLSEHLERVRIHSPWPDFFKAALPRSPLGQGRVVEV